MRALPDLSEAEYLSAEAISDQRHEFLNGAVYAMPDSSPIHSIIKVNLICALANRLADSPYRTFGGDMKLRVHRGLDVRHYYPDAMVVCRPQLVNHWQENPIAIFEVTSPETERTDRGEKLDAYQSIPSLRAYALIHSDQVTVVLHTRTQEKWETRLIRQPEEAIELPELGTVLTVQQTYEDTGMI